MPVCPGKTTCAAEHQIAKSGLEFVKLLIIDLTMAALVKIHPESAPDGNLLTATFVALEHFPETPDRQRAQKALRLGPVCGRLNARKRRLWQLLGRLGRHLGANAYIARGSFII